MCVCVCVCEREVTGSHSTVTQNVHFLCKATAGRYIRDPTNNASKSASSRLKEVLLQSVVQKLDREVGLRVVAKRLPRSTSWESRLSVNASRRYIGDSILNVFCCELL